MLKTIMIKIDFDFMCALIIGFTLTYIHITSPSSTLKLKLFFGSFLSSAWIDQYAYVRYISPSTKVLLKSTEAFIFYLTFMNTKLIKLID